MACLLVSAFSLVVSLTVYVRASETRLSPGQWIRLSLAARLRNLRLIHESFR